RKQLFTQFAIQIDERSFHGPAKEQNPKPSSFEKDGTVIYPFKDKDGHCYFDVCSCATCDEASYSYESDEDIRIRRRKKKDPLYKRYLEGDTSVGPLGEGKYDFIVHYSEEKDEPRQQIMMINPKDFPPQEKFLKNNVAHCPKILSQTVDSSGPSLLSQAEKVLNWQTENSLAQNQLLSTINHKVDQLAEEYNSRLLSLQKSITDIYGRLGNLHQEMMTMAKQMMANTTQFRNKEAETTSLKYQLRDLQKCLESMVQNQQANAYFNSLGGTPSSIPMYQGSYSPGFLFGQQTQKTRSPVPSFLSSDEVFTSRYGSTSTNYHTKTTRSKPRRSKESEFQVNPSKKPTLTSSSSHESVEDSKKKEKDIGIIEFSMANLLNNLSEIPELPVQKDQQPLSSRQITRISHYSDTNSSDYETKSNDSSLPRQFAIGEGSSTPKKEPDINEVYSSDEEMNYDFPNQLPNQEIPTKQFSSKIMLRKSAKATGLSFKKLQSQGGLNPFFNPHTIYFFHRPVQVNKKNGKVHALPTLIHHNDYQRGVRPDFNLNDNKPFEDFQTHAFRLNSATQSFPIPFVPNWFYYPIDYQMSLDEDLQFYLDKSDEPQVVKRAQKKKKRNSESQECPPEYFQDAQLPDDSMNIDEVGRMFNIDINDDSQQPQEKEPENVYEYPGDVFECPDDHYGCCEKHIIEFEMDH
ncbi:unnamed protein product, partial [Brassica rapa subsp. trilocularis]